MALRDYLVEWSAPDYRKAGSKSVKAKNKTEAVKKVKVGLGSKVKAHNLHHFSALGPFDKTGKRK